MKKRWFSGGILLLMLGLAASVFAWDGIPEKKQTKAGLYLDAQQAYGKWQEKPEEVHVLDVRTPEEYIFVGHAPMARNIPLLFLQYGWDQKEGSFPMKPNATFVQDVKEHYSPTDTLLVMCRSGSRSAKAANMLTNAGFTNVYSILDGFEGAKVKDSDSYFKGQRMINGWKNSSATWTYELDPQLMYMGEK